MTIQRSTLLSVLGALLLAGQGCGLERGATPALAPTPITASTTATTTEAKPKEPVVAEAPMQGPAPSSSDEVAPPTLPVPEESAPATPAPLPEPPKPVLERSEEPLFDKPFESVLVKKTVWVRATPAADGAELGMIGGRTRVGLKSHLSNDDCPTPWIEIEPRGWLCAPLKPSSKPPTTNAKKRPRALPGSYAIARKGGKFYKTLELAESDGKSRKVLGDMFQISRSKTLDDGRKFIRSQRGEWIESSHVGRLGGTKFAGVRLDQEDSPTLPFAFVVNHESKNGRANVSVYDEPVIGAKRKSKLKAKATVTLGEVSDDGVFTSIGEDQWVRTDDLRDVRLVEKPSEVVSGIWVDVDIDEQVVVVYRDKTPILATLGSSGKVKEPTPTGRYRVTRKKRRTTMASDRRRGQSYSVAVPWVSYFYEGYAFHAAYWHNSFGVRRSHGCINLSPEDALTIYEHLEPVLPAGWLAVYSHETEQPGSLVQIRGRVEVVPPPRPGEEEKKKKAEAKAAAAN